MAYTTAWIPDGAQPHTSTGPPEAAAGEPVILVVEDDWCTRRFICSALQHATNALVVDAPGPAGALSIVRSMGHRTGLLISDISLSAGKTGIDLAREITTDHPSIKVLLISGGDFPGHIPAEWRFLPKPFPIPVFLDCVNELCRSATFRLGALPSSASRAAEPAA